MLAIATRFVKRTIIIAALFSLLPILTGCMTPWHGPATTTDARGRTVCALHHIPLRTRMAYAFNGCFLEVEHSARIRAHYPNPWPAGFDTTRSRDCPNRTTVTFCDLCNRDAHLSFIP
jgi:hypothetical protein